MELALDTARKLSNDFRLEQDEPWGRLPNEPSESYDFFLIYLYLGPSRTTKEAYRQLLKRENALVPGQPAPDVPSRLTRHVSNWNFRQRALAWDERNWSEEIAIMDESRRNAVQSMVERQIEGWQVLQEASILSFFARDEETGEILLGPNGEPVVEMIEDKGIALRAWKHAVSGERTARGLPAELLAMTTEEIQRRIVTIHAEIERAQLEEEDSDIIDGDYTESPEA